MLTAMKLNLCPQCGAVTPRALCTVCCNAITRANRIADWDAIPAAERGDTSQELTDAVIQTMRAMAPEPEAE